jgi:hypothetical protein
MWKWTVGNDSLFFSIGFAQLVGATSYFLITVHFLISIYLNFIVEIYQVHLINSIHYPLFRICLPKRKKGLHFGKRTPFIKVFDKILIIHFLIHLPFPLLRKGTFNSNENDLNSVRFTFC